MFASLEEVDGVIMRMMGVGVGGDDDGGIDSGVGIKCHELIRARVELTEHVRVMLSCCCPSFSPYPSLCPPSFDLNVKCVGKASLTYLNGYK